MTPTMPTPSPWVTRFLSGMRPGATALDVACGTGRHIKVALDRGLRVTAIDRDISKATAFAGQTGVELIEADLETGQAFPVPTASFDCVIVTNYLWRPILPDIIAATKSDGLLIYETFAAGNERFGRPSNPDFLLRPGELIEAVRGHMTPVCYEHLQLSDPGRIVQRICACGPDHEWLSTPPLL
ncbi:MAG: class I SAM-dependent methyltransferase [Alphaproteobacteria bacterium]|nr:class I SAM-dependent methyltransferase [Alphaproteobacteria bacterium]